LTPDEALRTVPVSEENPRRCRPTTRVQRMMTRMSTVRAAAMRRSNTEITLITLSTDTSTVRTATTATITARAPRPKPISTITQSSRLDPPRR